MLSASVSFVITFCQLYCFWRLGVLKVVPHSIAAGKDVEAHYIADVVSFNAITQ